MSVACALVAVLLAAGFLGGLTGYLIEYKKDGSSTLLFPTAIVQGIAAAVAVPVLLNMISSNIVQTALSASSVSAATKPLLEVAGFAIVAALFARRFLTTLADRILIKAEEAKKDAEKALKKSDEAKRESESAKEQVERTADFVEAAVSEPESPGVAAGRVDAIVSQPKPEDPEVLQILKAMTDSKWVLRSVKGIAASTGLSREQINQRLTELLAKDLVGQRDGKNGPRWYATLKGRQLVT